MKFCDIVYHLSTSILNLDDPRVIRGKVDLEPGLALVALNRNSRTYSLPRTSLWNNLIARHQDFDPKCLVTNPKLPTFNLEPVSVKTPRPQILVSRLGRLVFALLGVDIPLGKRRMSSCTHLPGNHSIY